MIRWFYVAPRVLIAALVLAAIHFGTPHLLRWTLVNSLQSVTGAKVDVGDLRASLPSGQVILESVQLADASSPDRNLLAFDKAILKLETQNLAQRKLIVQRAHLTGLRFGTRRTTSGTLPYGEQRDRRSFGLGAMGEGVADWLEGAGRAMSADMLDQLESVALAQELSKRWPEQYAQLRAKIERWHERVEGLREQWRSIESGGFDVRRLERMQRTLLDLEQMQNELPGMLRQWDGLLDQVARDRGAIGRALANDKQRLQELFRLPNLDAGELSRYFLGEFYANQWSRLRRGVRLARRLSSAVSGNPSDKALSERGQWIELAQPEKPLPPVLFRSVSFEGMFGQQASARPVKGVARNVSPWLKLVDTPTTVQFQIGGQVEVRGSAVIESAAAGLRGRLQFRCDGFSIDGPELGQTEQLLVSLEAEGGSLAVDLAFEADRIDGHMQLEQPYVRLTPRLGPSLQQAGLEEHLLAAFGEVRELSASITVRGSLEQPNWQIESNLGTQLTAALSGAVQHIVSQRAEQLEAEVDQRIAQAMKSVESHLAEAHTSIAGQLQMGQDELQSLLGLVGGRSIATEADASSTLQRLLRRAVR